MKLTLALLSLFASTITGQLLFSGNNTCVSCLGQKNYICAGQANGTGCFNNPASCPSDQQLTNIFTTCSNLTSNSAVRSTNANCQKNIILNQTLLNSTNGTAQNISISLASNQFCTYSIINNLNSTASFSILSSNLATVTLQQLTQNTTVNFTNNATYNMINFASLSQSSGVTIPPGTTVLLMGANNVTNTTNATAATQIFAIQYQFNTSVTSTFAYSGIRGVLALAGLVTILCSSL